MRTLVVCTLLALSFITAPLRAAETQPKSVGYGLLHLAKAKGFFETYGVDVALTQDKPSTAAAIATGRLDGWATTVDSE